VGRPLGGKSLTPHLLAVTRIELGLLGTSALGAGNRSAQRTPVEVVQARRLAPSVGVEAKAIRN
jgi:hypothetical protein